MPQLDSAKQRKQTLIDLVNRIKVRAILRYAILDAMSNRLDYVYTEGAFSKFHAKPEVESAYELNEILALVHTSVDSIPDDKRLTARDAIQLFKYHRNAVKRFCTPKKHIFQS